ncbi:sensor histidine kinase [Comamonas serinivorans]|nr:ATP-binding protein [Comamonas serinivorans]
MTGRVLIAFALLLLQMVLTINNIKYSNQGLWTFALCVAYLAQTVLVRVVFNPVRPGNAFARQWVATALVDVVMFGMLQFTRSGTLTYLPLFVYPVLTSGVLATRKLALGTAALCTLILLGEPWLTGQHLDAQVTSGLMQGALASTGLLLVALLTNQLTHRLQQAQAHARRTQADAQRSRAEAQIMRLINERVIDAMPQGILVLNEKLQVRSANPAALTMLGLPETHLLASLRLTDQAGWIELVDVAKLTFARGAIDHAEINVTQRSRTQVHLTVNTQTTSSPEAAQRPMCLMFMQDLRESEAKLRTEKLASMGRMSAAVAHEIRNPLAAISQANALLQEELNDPMARRLTGMVEQNAQRLGRIVDDILDVARVKEVGERDESDALALDAHVRTLCQEWADQHQVGTRLQVKLSADEVLAAFRPDHLRRILVNLLDNAARYATHAQGAIQVSTHADRATGPVLLMVWSDGKALDQGVQKHLFEPFFSSESRSSGLGLYICQELCHRHGGAIAYERTPRQINGSTQQGNEFFISMKRWQHTANAPLDPDADTSR